MKEKIPNETKKERFLRLAQQRTNSVMSKLRILGNCANRNVYEYSEEEVRKMFSTIEEELQLIKSKFKNLKKEKFTF